MTNKLCKCQFDVEHKKKGVEWKDFVGFVNNTQFQKKPQEVITNFTSFYVFYFA